MEKTFKPVGSLPTIGADQIALLEKLSNASGVSGDEGSIRKIIRDEIGSIADELRIDNLGSLIAIRKAKTPNAPRILIAAHMDEVGFFVKDITDEGFLHLEFTVSPLWGESIRACSREKRFGSGKRTFRA